MRIEEALATKLRNTAGVAALVGNRIYPVKAPQATTQAYIVYDLIGGRVVTDHSGANPLREVRISYSCVAPTYAGAKGIAAAIRAALAGFRGTASTLNVSVHETYEDEDLYDDTLQLYLTVVDFELMWS